ncbi:MAG TPA: hypothetical protein VGJ60_26365 [Chloroflexota bacterium]|jgi:hypothetical protein
MRNQQSNALIFVRPSRHAGPDHRISVDAATLRPLSCTCQAGQHGHLCWAVIDITATELVWRARQRWQEACGEVDIRAAAAVLARARKWAAAALELQALRPRDHHQTPADDATHAAADLAAYFDQPSNYAHAAALAEASA